MIKRFGIIVIFTLIGVAVFYVFSLRKENERLLQQQALLEYKLTEQQQLVCKIRDQIKETEKYRTEIRNEEKKTQDIIKKAKENLDKKIIKNTKQMNSMIKKAFLCIELSSHFRVKDKDKRGCDL